jgi:hypothetical protein
VTVHPSEPAPLFSPEAVEEAHAAVHRAAAERIGGVLQGCAAGGPVADCRYLLAVETALASPGVVREAEHLHLDGYTSGMEAAQADMAEARAALEEAQRRITAGLRACEETEWAAALAGDLT